VENLTKRLQRPTIHWKIYREQIFGFISSTFEMPPRKAVRLPPTPSGGCYCDRCGKRFATYDRETSLYWCERECGNVQPYRERLPPGQVPHMIISANVEALKQHFDAGCEKLVQEILQQLRPVHTMLPTLDEVKAEVAAVAATVTEMREP
jgi:hypothetical protein